MLIDEFNRDLGAVSRKQIIKDRLWLRSGYVFILVTGKDRKQRFLISERTLQKSYMPGCFDLAAGGVFEPAESKLVNALRETEEELGLTLEF
jgi:8-oxo-dGTP pyrophosphatase MutT (NUDIX family)